MEKEEIETHRESEKKNQLLDRSQQSLTTAIIEWKARIQAKDASIF